MCFTSLGHNRYTTQKFAYDVGSGTLKEAEDGPFF